MNETDIRDVVGAPQPEEVNEAPEFSEDDFFAEMDSAFDGVGQESMNEDAELEAIEGSFFKAAELKEPRFVIPLNYRNLPEFWSMETLKALFKEDPAQARSILKNLKVNVLGNAQIVKVEFNKQQVEAFNKPIPDGQPKLYKSPTWSAIEDDNDPINWLSSAEKNADWFAQNLPNTERRPINDFQGTVSDSRFKTHYQITIPVIDETGSLRFIQTSGTSKAKALGKLSIKSMSEDNILMKDETTEWIGKPVMVTKDGTSYEFQILSSDSRLTEEQKARFAKTPIASQAGVSPDNRSIFGEGKSSPSRQIVLDFLGIRHLWEQR